MAGIKSIGILTSGGDAPGMNAAIRAVTRSAIYNGFTVKGIMRGFKGLVFNEIVEFKSQSVSNIIQLGGTILKTARSEEFKTVEGRKAAYDNMVAAGIDALVVIGGDGSLTGAGLFAEEYNVPIVGLPGTIDNDLGGTDSTIGYDTALNTIMESVDKLRDTASSHERLFFVEVMGHTAGYLALNSAIATGSEAAIIPEMETEGDQLPFTASYITPYPELNVEEADLFYHEGTPEVPFRSNQEWYATFTGEDGSRYAVTLEDEDTLALKVYLDGEESYMSLVSTVYFARQEAMG